MQQVKELPENGRTQDAAAEMQQQDAAKWHRSLKSVKIRSCENF